MGNSARVGGERQAVGLGLLSARDQLVNFLGDSAKVCAVQVLFPVDLFVLNAAKMSRVKGCLTKLQVTGQGNTILGEEKRIMKTFFFVEKR